MEISIKNIFPVPFKYEQEEGIVGRYVQITYKDLENNGELRNISGEITAIDEHILAIGNERIYKTSIDWIWGCWKADLMMPEGMGIYLYQGLQKHGHQAVLVQTRHPNEYWKIMEVTDPAMLDRFEWA